MSNSRVQCVRWPRVIIPLDVWTRILAYVHAAVPTEVNGLGYVSRDGDDFRITEVFILDQIVSAVDVEMDEQTIARYMHQMTRAGRSTNGMRFQWHSHVRMPAYFSSTDTGNIERWPGDWLISLVLNVRGDYSCRFDYLKLGIGVDLPIHIETAIPEDVMVQARDEVAEKVKRQGMLGRSRRIPRSSASLDQPTVWPEDLTTEEG